MQWIGSLGGVWGAATIAALIYALRLCYAVEKRSWPEKFQHMPWRKADVFSVAFNARGVAQDAETQALRRRMNLVLLAILAGFAVFGGLVFLAGMPPPA